MISTWCATGATSAGHTTAFDVAGGADVARCTVSDVATAPTETTSVRSTAKCRVSPLRLPTRRVFHALGRPVGCALEELVYRLTILTSKMDASSKPYCS